MTHATLRLLCIAVPLALAACSRSDPNDANLDSLDAELVNGTASNQASADPAVRDALQDQIMVDPGLAQQSNADAVRPGDQPYAAPVPADDIAAGNGPAPTGPLLKAPAPKGDCPGCAAADQSVTLAGLAARQRTRGVNACIGGLRYSASWATRLGELPIYPRARLVEAAGNNANGCALRVASFATAAPLQNVIDFYYTRATGAGYASEHQADGRQHVLGGTRARDDGAFILYAEPRDGGGTQFDIIVNNGN